MTRPGDRLSPDKVKLGVCCTLWWNDDFPTIDAGISFGQAVSEMALAGFQGCSIGHKYPSDATELKAALDLRGLRVSDHEVSGVGRSTCRSDGALRNVGHARARPLRERVLDVPTG